jgi:hypothetical protein
MVDENIFRTGVNGIPKIGSIHNHPLHGKIEIIKWYGYVAGCSIVDAKRIIED